VIRREGSKSGEEKYLRGVVLAQRNCELLCQYLDCSSDAFEDFGSCGARTGSAVKMGERELFGQDSRFRAKTVAAFGPGLGQL